MEQGTVRSRWYRRAGAAAMVAALAFVLVPAAGSDVPAGRAAGAATGTILHADLLKSGGTKLVDTNVAFSGAVFDSKGISKPWLNEMEREFAPALIEKLAYGRGFGLDAGLAATPDKANQIILAGLAEKAAPLGGLATKEIGPVDLDPLAWANLLRGRAAAADAGDACVIGADISNSVGYVADAQLLDMGTSSAGESSQTTSTPVTDAAPEPAKPVAQTVDNATAPVRGLLGEVAPEVADVAPQVAEPAPKPAAPKRAAAASSTTDIKPVEGLSAPVVSLDADGPKRATSESFSRTLLVGQRAKDGELLGHNFGVMSEVRQTIAPVTFFKGTSNEFTLEFLGEWVLQAVATGMPGGAYVHYGPGAVSPSTPVMRVLDETGVTDIITLQDLLGAEGLVIEVPGVAEIAIGEDPRAIGGNADSAPQIAANGTSAATAVDVVRVKLLPGAPAQLADLRIGHMEVRSMAPEGGVRCSIPVSKKPSVEKVNVGDAFTVDFSVTNPYDCTLTDVTMTDNITTKDAARFAIVGTSPNATELSSGSGLDAGKITWKLGDMAPHSTKKMSAEFRALGGTGEIIDEAVASGAIDDCAKPGAIVGGVSVAAVDAIVRGDTPSVKVPVAGTVVAGINQTREFPLTGAPIALLVTLALALLAAGGAALTLAYQMKR